MQGQRTEEALADVEISPDEPFAHGDFRPRLEPIFEEIEHPYRDDKQGYFHPIIAGWQVMSQQMACHDERALKSRQTSLAVAARLRVHHAATLQPRIPQIYSEPEGVVNFFPNKSRDAFCLRMHCPREPLAEASGSLAARLITSLAEFTSHSGGLYEDDLFEGESRAALDL